MKKKTKNVQQEVIENAHKVWLAGLGAFATAEEEGSKFLKNLMEKGENIEAKGKKQMDKELDKAKGAATGVKTIAESYWDTFGRTIDDTMTQVIHRLGVPTNEDIKGLNKKVAELTKTVDNLKTGGAKPAAKKPAARKPAARKPAAKAAAAKKPAAKKPAAKPTTTK